MANTYRISVFNKTTNRRELMWGRYTSKNEAQKSANKINELDKDKTIGAKVVTEKNTDKREVVTVYAIDENNRHFRVAGYEKNTGLKAVKDKTVKAILHAVKLIAIDSNGNIIATSEDL